MAETSSLNCLSCRIPYQCLLSLNALNPFSEKALLFTDFCFIASPSKNRLQILENPPKTRLTEGMKIHPLNSMEPKVRLRGTVITCFALIGLVAWERLLDSTLRKLSFFTVHSAPKTQWTCYGVEIVTSHSSHCSECLFPLYFCGDSPFIEVQTSKIAWCTVLFGTPTPP